MYAFVGTGTFIGAALLTVPKPTSTPNANNGERMSFDFIVNPPL
jgi:hypothetical protein